MIKNTFLITTLGLLLSACGGSGSSGSNSPHLEDTTITNLSFGFKSYFDVKATNTEDSIFLDYKVIEGPEYGVIDDTRSSYGQFGYTPTSIEGINGDTLKIQVVDSFGTYNTATISLDFTNQTAPTMSFSPEDGSENISVNDNVTVFFSDPVDPETIVFNDIDNNCSGSIQVSADDFQSCQVINNIDLSVFNRRLTIDFDEPFDSGETYTVKVLTDIKNYFDVSVADETASSFTTSGDLLITEVSECYYNNTYCWFEIYNGSSEEVDLSSYSFRSPYINSSSQYRTNGDVTFSLPNTTINSGQYIVIRSDKDGDSFASNSRIVFAHESGNYPYWSDQGYIDLIKDGESVDFVTFGYRFSSFAFGEWSGVEATGPRSEANKYGASIGRDGNNKDTNTNDDWNVYEFATMGGVNDANCTTDADQDGIPDCSEEPGSTYAGLPLYDWGARTGQKDIFIELDYMDGTNNGAQSLDEGILPRKEALQKVVDVFAEQGIAVHFDVGDLYDNAADLDPSDFDLGGGQEVPFVDGMTFSTTPSVYDYKVDYFDYSRFQIFHYLLFVNTQNGSAGSSGLAEINGNDLIVSLGEWGLSSNTTSNTNRLINFQASTLMHELGHNLGLLHGGNENDNNKPNYFSIMNYLYQLNGLSEIGNNEGDRYYDEYFNGNANCDGPLTNPSSSDTFIMDFSHGVSAAITKNSANETLGLGQLNSSGVDFNCDGDVADTAADTGQGMDTWTDYDDWGNINLDFRNYFSGNQHGLSLVASSEDDLLIVDKVGNDRAPIAQEYSPSPEFFEKLKEQMNQ